MADLSLMDRYEALRVSRSPNFPATSHFGRNVHGYDLGGEDGQGHDPDIHPDDFGDGSPGVELVRECLLNFARRWQTFDVAVAASVFNISESMIANVAPFASDYLASQVPEDQIGRLVQLVSMQRSVALDDGYHLCTAAEVAALLNLPEPRIVSAVEDYPWMYLGPEYHGSPTIEHDGE